jgi:hypothetical protein
MTRARSLSLGLTALLTVVLVGCQQPSMEDMMKPPQRPAELDHLNMFVGQWDGSGEMTMPGADKPMTSKGHSNVRWAADGWALIEEYEETMGDGGTTKGLALWTWDPKGKKFHTIWLSSHGELSHGTAKYDAATRTWQMHGEDNNPYTGMRSIGEGTARFTDDNTMEWSYTAYGPWKMKKLFEMKGASHKK